MLSHNTNKEVMVSVLELSFRKSASSPTPSGPRVCRNGGTLEQSNPARAGHVPLTPPEYLCSQRLCSCADIVDMC